MYNRLYVHVPFCIKKCHYCAFSSAPPHKNELEEYPFLLLRQLGQQLPGSKPLDSIYFGGGTPSLLQPEQIAELLEGIARHSNISAEAEITMEANPGTVDSLSLKKYREAGINRISLGIQSFDDDFLLLMGRIHSTEQSKQAFQNARTAGFNNISIDLMHSLPGQTLHRWHNELQQAINLSPEHISVYGLTIEQGTPFAFSYPEENPELADEDLSADMFELTDQLLTAAGFEHYEIANYARPGFRSEHNSGYWKRDGYLGLGVAAHSFLREGSGIRFNNPETLDEYRRGVNSDNRQRLCEQQLTQKEAMAEYMYLGLRLSDGVDIQQFKAEFGQTLESVYKGTAADLVKLGLLKSNGNLIFLTQRGMLLSNQVFARYL